MNKKAYSNLLKFIIAIVILSLLLAKPIMLIPHSVYNINNKPIFDLGFHITDRIYQIPQTQCDSKFIYERTNELVLAVLIIYMFYSLNVDIILRFAYCLILLQILKRLLAISTVLPNPERNKCYPLYNVQNPLKGTCNDLFFSGHFIMLNLVGYMIWRFMWSPTLGGLYTIFYLFSVYWNLSCQYHYTIDILASIPITLFVAILMFRNVQN